MQQLYYDWGHVGIGKQSCMLLDILGPVRTDPLTEVLAPCHLASHLNFEPEQNIPCCWITNEKEEKSYLNCWICKVSNVKTYSGCDPRAGTAQQSSPPTFDKYMCFYAWLFKNRLLSTSVWKNQHSRYNNDEVFAKAEKPGNLVWMFKYNQHLWRLKCKCIINIPQTRKVLVTDYRIQMK